MKKPVLFAASLLLLGVGASACGSGTAASAPKDASRADFCAETVSIFAEVDLSGRTPDDAEVAQQIGTWGARLAELGSPSDMSALERKGFEYFIATAVTAKAEDVKKGLKDFGNPSQEEEKQSKAFSDYVEKACSDEFEKAMSDVLGDDLGGLKEQYDDATQGLTEQLDKTDKSLEQLEKEAEEALAELEKLTE